MKEIFITNGQHDFTFKTQANTKVGYIRAVKRIWPFAGISRIKIKVCDYATPGDPIIFETTLDIS